MISICIPVYNYKVDSLVQDLSIQLELLKVQAEILVIDDGSDDEYRKFHQEKLYNIPYCKYVELLQNVGRAKIRNLFLNYIQYDYLLFLDCDVKIISNDFVFKYIQFIHKYQPSVVCGGFIYPNQKPERKYLLRWFYGNKKESKPASIRSLNPYQSFMTSNFLIRKEIFKNHKFDENIQSYGHEDTLLGYELKQKNIPIFHLDNPVLIDDKQTNEDFLQKIEFSMDNLIYILKKVNFSADFIEDVKLLKFYFQYEKFINTFYKLFGGIKPIFRFLLSKGYFYLFMLDVYKLIIFVRCYREIGDRVWDAEKND